MRTHSELIDQYIREGRTVSGGKNDQAKADAHNAAVQSQTNTASQMQFNDQLMKIFQSQYAGQKGVLDYLQGKMQSNINNPKGYTDAQLTSMRTQATDSTAAQFQNAQKALQNNAAMGTDGLPSGVRAQNEAALQAAQAGAQSNAQENITAADANLQQSNYWNSVNTLSGVAAQQNPLGYSGARTSGTEAVSGGVNATSGASNAQTNAYNAGNSWMGMVGGLAGGAVKGFTGGLFGGSNNG